MWSGIYQSEAELMGALNKDERCRGWDLFKFQMFIALKMEIDGLCGGLT